MKPNTPIVIVAYNRTRSLNRLLQSVASANYPNTDIELIISIDFADDNKEILEIAEQFEWKYGKKTVRYQEKNLGLRKHILKCGDLSLKYGSVIILEDDLFVSPNFYNYTRNALDFCKDQSQIGGISLYNHQLNVHTQENFSAIEDGHDNWYFQFASSWGQAWTKNQWQNFMEWYHQNPIIDEVTAIPPYVRSWSEKSWLKYNIAYLIKFNRYFLYPKISLTTNFSDAGTHVGNDSTIFQVPILNSIKKDYQFCTPDESSSIYDAFYENTKLWKYLGLNKNEITIDLYGIKKNIETQYLISSNILNFEIIRSFSKSLKPIEANIIYGLNGDELFLYNTKETKSNSYKVKRTRAIIYNHKHIRPRDGLKVYLGHWGQRIKRLFSISGIG